VRGNVLFVTADQWRGECLSALGHPVVRTPSLDALAGQGVLFARHYAQAAPCGPSRASLHTGLYLQSHRSGTNGTPLDDRHTNWALEARELGYDPVLFGYTDTSRDPRSLEPDSPWRSTYEAPLRGLRPVVLMGGERPVAWAEWLAKKGYAVPDEPWKLYVAKKRQAEWEDGGPSPAPLAIPAEHHDTHFMVDRVIEHLAEAGGEPWIVHLSLFRPHPPWVAPEPYHALYDPASLPGFSRAGSADAEAARHPWLRYHLGRPRNRAPADERKLRRLKASYYGLMTEVDHELGRLFAWLESQGLWRDTLVIVTSDHGEQMGDHWVLGKAGWFEASYRIPLLVRDPRASADATRGRVVDAFTENVDVMPTLLSWLGAEVPVGCDGRSLLPFLESGEPPADWRREVHHEYDFRDVRGDAPGELLGLAPNQACLAVLRDARGKYVHFAGLLPLFFDLERDPGEHQDLARDPAYAPRVLEYAQRMLDWRLARAEQALGHLHVGEGGVFERRAGARR
jgi:arylsulfatase A-like enzyme